MTKEDALKLLKDKGIDESEINEIVNAINENKKKKYNSWMPLFEEMMYDREIAVIEIKMKYSRIEEN